MKNGIDISHVKTPTPTPSQAWLAMESKLQLEICQKLLNENNFDMDVVATNARGEVIVQFRKLFESAKRGTVLLDAESILKRYDPALTIYLQAKDDRNPLRRLRGVIINDDRN